MKYPRRALAILMLAALAVFLTLPRQATAQSTNEAQLTALAREAVEAQNDILVGGDVETALGRRRGTDSYRGAIAEHFPSLVRRKRALAKKKNDYKAHKTELRIHSTFVEGARATQNATEYVVLALDPALGGPTQTEYEQEHVFEYEKVGNRWVMIADRIPPPPLQTEVIEAPAATPPTLDAPADYQPQAGLGPRPGVDMGPTSSQGALFTKASYSGAKPFAYASYNGTAAAVYALTYWSSYNTAQYRTYSENDCTNFISQALAYGGWPYDTSGERTGSNTWYYGSYTFNTSYSWAGAHNFFQFFWQSGRGIGANYFQDMVRGDILQADWGPSPDGGINHSMIVTNKDAYNTIYLTYHSTNTKNRSITDLLASNPGTNWYGMRMYSGF
ncbi:MAG: amidase domain-containing protein [Pyrinomonadaceae bacterium]